jgi:hypothetical protein
MMAGLPRCGSDASTDRRFSGKPAAAIPVECRLDDGLHRLPPADGACGRMAGSCALNRRGHASV